ncbi:MAG TPA: GNAT family N-acetyltransferase [Chloroflexia bacterium]|nr:GNAT family N-acetyltransferase [Chloroflexia bacterium]
MLIEANHTVSIIPASQSHLAGTKRLSDRNKRELGFVNRAILEKAIVAGELLVAVDSRATEEEPDVAGFVHFYVRRDQVITLYSIVVSQAYQGTGLGRRLFEALVIEARQRGKQQILLKCPTELAANLFYERMGLEIIRVEEGKRRPLNVWAYTIR